MSLSGRAAKASLATPLEAMPAPPAWPFVLAGSPVCAAGQVRPDRRLPHERRRARPEEPDLGPRAVRIVPGAAGRDSRDRDRLPGPRLNLGPVRQPLGHGSLTTV